MSHFPDDPKWHNLTMLRDQIATNIMNTFITNSYQWSVYTADSSPTGFTFQVADSHYNLLTVHITIAELLTKPAQIE